MKNVLYRLLVERNVRSKVELARQKGLIDEMVAKDYQHQDYNPKTARHRSLKNINARLIKF